MKTVIFAIGALALASTVAHADPANENMLRWNQAQVPAQQVVTRNTITGYAASAAAAEGVALNPAPSKAPASVRSGRIMRTGLVRSTERKGGLQKPAAGRGAAWDGDVNEG